MEINPLIKCHFYCLDIGVHFSVNHPPLDKFFKKDIDAALALVDLFQEGTHNVMMPVNQNQIMVLKIKMESTLRFILEVNKMN